MQIPLPFLSAIETAINAWLKLDDEALPRFAELDGKIIRLHITGLDLNLYFLPASSGIQVMGSYSSEEEGGIVDATIHGAPMALMRLGTSTNAGKTLLESDVEIDGDMRIAEKFSAILSEVDIDWEDHLSKLVGTIIAHQAGQVTRNAKGWIKDSAEKMQSNTAEYLNEESELIPTEAEVSDFINQVDEIRMAVDRLDARIKLLTDNKFEMDK